MLYVACGVIAASGSAIGAIKLLEVIATRLRRRHGDDVGLEILECEERSSLDA